MYIQQNSNNVNMYGSKKIPNFWNRLKNSIWDKIPDKTFTLNEGTIKKIRKYEEQISHPAKNRLIMGATALVTQPTIDYYNHKVDEDTRTISRNRTIAKILAGTSVGILVRGASYSIVEKMTDIKGKKKYSKALLPNKDLDKLLRNQTFLKNYRSALSTSLAILAMCFTNFLIDAPLTVYLTNKFNDCHKQKKKGGNLNV